MNTLPMPGMDANRALTTTFSSGTRLMTRSGRSTLIVLSDRTQPRLPEIILPTMPIMTMKPSMQFHGSLRYESLSSRYRPNAISFMTISSANTIVKKMSTPSRAFLVPLFSIALGDSKAIVSEEMRIKVMMT